MPVKNRPGANLSSSHNSCSGLFLVQLPVVCQLGWPFNKKAFTTSRSPKSKGVTKVLKI